MSKRQVVVELLPDHIDVVEYVGSTRAQAQRLSLHVESDANEWARSIRRSAASVRAIVEEFNAVGQPAVVLYRSPTQAIDLFNGALRSPAEAIEAAVLSCCDSLSYSSLSAVCEGTVVGRDASGDERQTHVVVAAEREDIAEAISAMVVDAGLKLVSVTPVEAAVAAFVLHRALTDKRPHQGWLYIGEHASLFVVASEGRLLFSRRISLGLDALARSLTRPIRISGRDEPVSLTMDEARQILTNKGIPDRDDNVYDVLGLRGTHVIPLLQPVLQRFIVELRQSLRFGVRDEDRPNIRIDVTGPGSSLPSLAKLVQDELSVEITSDAAYARYLWSEAGSGGSEMIDALRRPATLRQINLLPLEIARTRRTGRFRQWLWTGAAVAMGVIAVDGFRYQGQLQAARKKAESMNVTDIETLKVTEAKLLTAVTAMNELEAMIRKEVQVGVDFRACLQELTLITPEPVRFTSVNFDRRDGVTMGRISGYAFLDEGMERTTDLELFIEQLRESPLFQDAVLKNVQIGAIGGLRGQRFETTFGVTPIGPDLAAADASASKGGGT